MPYSEADCQASCRVEYELQYILYPSIAGASAI